MKDKYNIKIQNKLTKKIDYYLNLEVGYWVKGEYDSSGNEIYFETSKGIIKDDR